MGKSYWFASRPPDVSHRHPFLVFDCQDQLHFELTVFGKEAAARGDSPQPFSSRGALLPFFTYLEMDEWQVRAGQNWKCDPESIRRAVEDYLIHQLHCSARQHQQGFFLVLKTNQTHQTVKLFLSGLKFFYQMMCQQGYYGHPNPLIDSGASMVQFIEVQDTEIGRNYSGTFLALPAAALEKEGDFAGTPRAPARGLRPLHPLLKSYNLT